MTTYQLTKMLADKLAFINKSVGDLIDAINKGDKLTTYRSQLAMRDAEDLRRFCHLIEHIDVRSMVDAERMAV